MEVELFVSDCKLCEGMLHIMEEVFPYLEITVHRASECIDGSCCARAAEVGVKAVPALAMNGKVIQTGLPMEEELDALKKLLGKPSGVLEEFKSGPPSG